MIINYNHKTFIVQVTSAMAQQQGCRDQCQQILQRPTLYQNDSQWTIATKDELIDGHFDNEHFSVVFREISIPGIAAF
jgi:hypothetical protein